MFVILTPVPAMMMKTTFSDMKSFMYVQCKQEIALFSWKIYTAGTNFTRPPVVTVATNLNSAGDIPIKPPNTFLLKNNQVLSPQTNYESIRHYWALSTHDWGTLLV